MNSVLSLSELRRENKKAYERGKKVAINTIINSVALHLLDKGVLDEDIDKNREMVKRVLDAVLQDCEEIIEDRININDIRDTLKDEYGITIWFE